MTRRRDPSSYEVGYGKPPVEHRFKPGASGNPKGRPKGRKNIKTDLAEELNQPVVVSEGGCTRKITKQRALLKSLLSQGIKGNVRASTAALTLVARLVDGDVEGTDHELTDDQIATLEDLGRRIDAWRAGREAKAAPASDSEPTAAIKPKKGADR